MASETFGRFAKFYPDRVSNAGVCAELDGYRIDVADMGRFVYRWWLSFNDRHVASGEGIAPAVAWLLACDALDRHKAELGHTST